LKKTLHTLCVIITFAALFSLTVSAAPTDSYNRQDQPGGNSVPVITREMHTATQSITAAILGLDKPLEGLTDIFSGEDGTIYILCGKRSRLIQLNKDYTLKKELTIKDQDGNEADFTGAQGIYADKNKNIYIADTSNARVLITDSDGLIKDIWEVPQSALIPNEFLYQPIAIDMDNKGYVYILSNGSYYGSLAFSPQGVFMGFFGANTVKASALDTMAFLWDKITGNDTKRAASVKTLPYSFVDLCIDPDGYMVTCTGSLNPYENGEGQIRKIGPDGSNILYKRNTRGNSVSSSIVNFLEKRLVVRQNNLSHYIAQDIVSINVNEKGFIYALDKTNGTIYLYDGECNLLNAFGGGLGTGRQLGVFNAPISLTLHESSVLVADSSNNSITVFNITDYGSLVLTAQSMYLKGDYTEAKLLWEQVLAEDSGNQFAYRGLAMACYSEGNIEAALDYAKAGLDYTVYDLAWQTIITDFLARNFIWIFIGAIVLIAGITTLLVYIKKRKAVLITNPKIKTVLAVPFHPFRSFEELKCKKQGSLIIAAALTTLLFIAFMMSATASGFLFTDVSPQQYNIFYTLAQTVGLLLLWTISNWLICSMFSGKGRLREIFTATAYSLTPLIIFTFVRVILSNFMPFSGTGFLNGLQTAVWVFTFFLLCIAMITVHEYDFFKFFLTGIVVVFFMILVVFILFMISILLMQFWDFIKSVYEEIAYR